MQTNCFIDPFLPCIFICSTFFFPLLSNGRSLCFLPALSCGHKKKKKNRIVTKLENQRLEEKFNGIILQKVLQVGVRCNKWPTFSIELHPLME